MSAKSDILSDRLYTRDHEWALFADGTVQIGVAAYAVDQLGDITLVNIDVKPGDVVAAGKAFGTIESVKTLSDLFSPVSGTIVAVNAELADRPEIINEDCYGKGWMITISPSHPDEKKALLDAAAYGKLIADH